VWHADDVPLDPIVSLAVAIAEAPGSYACLLGSGVSRDAGVPTGMEVFWLAVGELYRLENTAEEAPGRDALAAWLRETDRADLGYSDVLELLTPDAATRRDYLAKHFDGVEPAAPHERLAELAVRGLVTVFITTNFDRLLERALQARGIVPIVVTSDADLNAAPSREHADCFVLKPHGDYLQQTIRNTPAELAQLESGIAAELREVLDRYGVIVLGYSGGDEAIANAIRARRSRYGLYWVARGEVAEPGCSIVEAVGGRVIARAGAAEFLADLDRRLAVFEAQPSGLTPVTVNDEVVTLLRRSDSVGLSELLRGERREFRERVDGLVQRRRQEAVTADIAIEAHDELLPVLERRLASLLPLVLHDPDLFREEVRGLAEVKTRQPVAGGHQFWPELYDWTAWWLTYSIGAFATRMRRFPVLAPLFRAQVRNRYGTVEPFADSMPGRSGGFIGDAIMARLSDTRWKDTPWEALLLDLKELPLLRERYPELVGTSDEPLRTLVEFDFVVSIVHGLSGYRAVARWTMWGEEYTSAFAQELRDDAGLRAQLAEAVGVNLEDFDSKTPDALKSVHHLGDWPERGAILILETGSA